MGEEAFARARAEGRAMGLERAVEYCEQSLIVHRGPGDKPLEEATHLTFSDQGIGEGTRPVPRGGSPGSEPARLTRREREIAALVARGMTNRRVAAELALSERTVETHVRNVLKKLGLKSRVQLAERLLGDDRAKNPRSLCQERENMYCFYVFHVERSPFC
jgi:DNA-binding CsgD family transcriptional regulator